MTEHDDARGEADATPEPDDGEPTFASRFADGPTTTVACVVAATPDEVWAVISDPGFPPQHSDELYRAEWEDPSATPGVGSRIHGWNRSGDMEWDTYSTVTVWEPPQRFEWTVDEAAPGWGAIATWWFQLEPATDDGHETGGTRVVQGVRLGPGRSYLTKAIKDRPDREAEIIAFRLGQQRQAMQHNLTAVAAAVESTGTDG